MVAAQNLIAASIPKLVVANKSRDNVKRIHYALGLGDGNMYSNSQTGLRGKKIRPRDDTDSIPEHKDESRRFNLLPVVTDDADLNEFLRRGVDRRAAAMAHRQEVVTDAGDALFQQPASPPLPPFGPTSDSWQISFIIMLGICAIIVGFFIHYSNEVDHTAYLRRRSKKKPKFASPSYRKKTDEWSEDEEFTEDDNYGADNEGTSRSSVTKKRAAMTPQPQGDPTARLYYNLNTGTNFREQEHRLRRSANHQSNIADPYQASPTRVSSSSSVLSNRGALHAGGGTNKIDRSAHGATFSRASTVQTNNPTATAATIPSPKPSPPSIPFDSSGLGSGLEGFEPPISPMPPPESPSNNEPVVLRRNLVKPMGPFTPTQSFSSLDVVAAHAAKSKEDVTAYVPNQQSEDNTTPPITLEDYSYSSPDRAVEAVSSPIRPQALPFSSPQRSYPVVTGGELADLPTPRVDHTSARKRELAKILKTKGKDLPVPPVLRDDSYQNIAPNQKEVYTQNGAADDIPAKETLPRPLPELPSVPYLNHSSDKSPSSDRTDDAPRSVLLEELQLVRMESGVSGPKWRTNIGVDDTSPLESGGQSFQHPMFGNDNASNDGAATATDEMRRQETENLEKLKQAAEPVDPADDPRNSIQHIRTDLTFSSDSSSSLSSKIKFSELKLEDVIGGGGFGQVWKAKWKGTPVAVKVLTGTAQAEKIPKAVLEEFIGEINMVSGMRHPNICLFMGACLDAPNRAIITELCENGSLWDALRLPLASLYRAADGVTRDAWPIELYEQLKSPPLIKGESERPMAPKGAWPWHLVKRVASGTARGMCYLHSGNPPVLHRDLKSANILLDESYTAKLADFGLSRLKAVRSGMTGNCGTVQWMSPEVLCSEDYAEPADVFSFGIILWEMLAQECPYEGMTPIQCALAVLNQNHRPEIPAWCPQPFRALIKNCVERDPKARPTFPQVLQALDDMC